MTNLDHGKFSRATTMFHSLLALTVFVLFFTGYAIAFNTELWWLVELMGGNRGVLSIHRLAGFALIALTGFWVPYMLLRSSSRSNFRGVLPAVADVKAFVQDVKFALGRADERHPAARQFGGYKADEVPLISYIGKGVIWIFTVELLLLMISGLLIWRKTWLIDFYNSQTVVMAFVAFHGLLGVIMLMGVMFHTFEHGFHPAFYPVEMKAFLPKDRTPGFHGDSDDYETTGIERLRRKRSWRWTTNVMGVLVVVGIVSMMMASLESVGNPTAPPGVYVNSLRMLPYGGPPVHDLRRGGAPGRRGRPARRRLRHAGRHRRAGPPVRRAGRRRRRLHPGDGGRLPAVDRHTRPTAAALLRADCGDVIAGRLRTVGRPGSSGCRFLTDSRE
ncbi:cytochrome b/b6 domain-containing protein [Haloterrigena alkaliphila]|uniref:cytochrome b/b6 domain-containing protein n=1 Tax=Haloterrigena alkaliphila TaxID=2816475 RepID=UPI001CEDC4BA|nr:cytochrome b/b6 domain-containing protein [Haloterrigena alkaliphila]UHQ95028.1 cytochrome b/b6 domain-containing protein [Haloterrigena alkaliphila]